MPGIILPAKLENLESMIKFITDAAEKEGISGRKLYQIQLASEEAFLNIIKYAYPDKNGNVEIDYYVEQGKGFVIEIVDWGIPFDPLSLPEPDIEAPIEERKIGGLGIYMMKNAVDEINYRRDGDRNILTLMKY